MTERENLNRIRKSIIGAAIEVHRALGPGLLESAYQARLTFELAERGLKVERQKPLPVIYREVTPTVVMGWIFSSNKRSLSRLRPLIACRRFTGLSCSVT